MSFRPLDPADSSMAHKISSKYRVELTPSTKRILGWLSWFDFCTMLFLYFGASVLHEISTGVSELQFLSEDVLHYSFTHSIFDIVMIALLRPVLLEICYIHDFNKNVAGIAFTTGISTFFVVLKLILGRITEWYFALLIIATFAFSWSEMFVIFRNRESGEMQPLLGPVTAVRPTHSQPITSNQNAGLHVQHVQHPSYYSPMRDKDEDGDGVGQLNQLAYSPSAYWTTVSSVIGDFDLESAKINMNKPAAFERAMAGAGDGDGDDSGIELLPDGRPIPGYDSSSPINYSEIRADALDRLHKTLSDESLPWEELAGPKDVKMSWYLRESTGMYVLRASCVIQRPAWSVANVLSGFEHRKMFDSMFSHGEILLHVDKFTNVCRMYCKAIWPTAPRDSVYLQSLRQDPDGVCTIASVSVHGGAPPDNGKGGYVRAVMSPSGYIVRPQPNQGDDMNESESCIVEMLIDSNTGGNMPKMLYNIGIKSQPLALEKLARLMEKQPPHEHYLGLFSAGYIKFKP